MHMAKETKKHSSARSLFVCGVTSALLGQACIPGKRPATEKEMAYQRATVQDGQENLLPVLEEFAEIANEENLYGFNGHGGKATFFESLHKSAAKLDEMTESGNIFVTDTPNYHASATYTDHDGRQDVVFDSLDSITYNLSFTVFMNPDEVWDDPLGRQRAGYGLSLHEASHEWTKHSDTVEDYQDTVIAERPTLDEENAFVLEQERDFAYLIGNIMAEIEYFREFNFINERETGYIWERLHATIQSVDQLEADGRYEEAEAKRQEWVAFQDIISTPEGYTNYISTGLSILRIIESYWGISEEEQIRIISESGWYEDFVEERMIELKNEAQRELGLEYQEREWRDIDLGDLTQWRRQIQADKQAWEEQNREVNEGGREYRQGISAL